MEGITKKQADIIGEVANICTGNAATALSMIINRPTNITTPVVEVLTKEESLVKPDRILVKVPYTKGLDGTNLMILKEQDALIIANLMMGGSGDPTGMQFDEITISAKEKIKEVQEMLLYYSQNYINYNPKKTENNLQKGISS